MLRSAEQHAYAPPWDLRGSSRDVRHWWHVVDRDPIWAPVRSDPRFKAIAEQLRQAARVQREKLDVLRPS